MDEMDILNHLHDFEKKTCLSGMVSSFVTQDGLAEWLPNLVAHHSRLEKERLSGLTLNLPDHSLWNL